MQSLSAQLRAISPRTLALFLVLAAACLPSLSRAQSSRDPTCTSAGICSQGEAYQACMAFEANAVAELNRNFDRTDASASGCSVWSSTSYRAYAVIRGKSDRTSYMHWALNKTCAATPSKTTRFLPVTGSTGCNLGCTVTYAQNIDETSVVTPTGGVCTNDQLKKNCPSGSYWNGYMGVCEPVQKSCPDNQELKDGVCHPKNQCPDGMVSVQGSTPGAVQEGSLYCKPAETECPAGNVKSPSGKCLPGDGQCAAGEANRENGTCGKDKDGDGKADEDDDDPDNDPKKDSASGGDECDAPPSCSGNAIQCIQVKIQWRIDCNTRRQVNINGGTCEAVPICTGKACNAMEYAQLMQQWRATCALEKLAKKDGDDKADGSDANGNGVPDALEGTGDVADAGDGTADVQGTKKFGIGVSTSLLSQENIFGGGSCPQPPTFKLMGQTISGSDFPYWCQAMAILRSLILMWGAYIALKILMGWGF